MHHILYIYLEVLVEHVLVGVNPCGRCVVMALLPQIAKLPKNHKKWSKIKAWVVTSNLQTHVRLDLSKKVADLHLWSLGFRSHILVLNSFNIGFFLPYHKKTKIKLKKRKNRTIFVWFQHFECRNSISMVGVDMVLADVDTLCIVFSSRRNHYFVSNQRKGGGFVALK